MKAKTFGWDDDLVDFQFLLKKMDEEEENFGNMALAPEDEDKDMKILTATGKCSDSVRLSRYTKVQRDLERFII
jgi:hypothetical protein